MTTDGRSDSESKSCARGVQGHAQSSHSPRTKEEEEQEDSRPSHTVCRVPDIYHYNVHRSIMIYNVHRARRVGPRPPQRRDRTRAGDVIFIKRAVSFRTGRGRVMRALYSYRIARGYACRHVVRVQRRYTRIKRRR